MDTTTPRPLTLEEFCRLPKRTLVAKTWPYQGDNAEPEIWQRVSNGNYWVELTDFNNSYSYAPNAAYSEGAIHLVIWQLEAGA